MLTDRVRLSRRGLLCAAPALLLPRRALARPMHGVAGGGGGGGGGGEIIDVANASALDAAFNAAGGVNGGKTLRLAAGVDYGVMGFGVDYSSNPITIQGQAGSQFNWIEASGCYGVTFKDFNCYGRGSPSSVYVHDGNDNLTFSGVTCNSGQPQDQNLDNGFYFVNVPATNIKVIGHRDPAIPDLWGHGAGVAIRLSSGITLQDLSFANTAVDHISLQGASNILIDGCWGHNSFYGTGDHPDFVEGFSVSTTPCANITVRNCGWQRDTDMDSQFVFLAGVQGATIENNWSYGTSTNSIVIGADGGTGASSNVTLTNNFCQGLTDLSSSILIRGGTSNATLANNAAHTVGSYAPEGPYSGYSETGTSIIADVPAGDFTALDAWLAANPTPRRRL